jgi:hypothetical protein
MSIDLSQNRVFAFESGKRKYTMTIKPITKAMWLKYFAGIVSTQELTPEGDTASSFDATGARVELLESVLIDATGYTREGVNLGDTEGWQSKLPIGHRRAVADLLVAVESVPPALTEEEAVQELGVQTVVLKATWTAGDDGKMHQVTGLKHVLREPTAAHQVRYSRAFSQSIVVGGSRTGQTRWLGAQKELIEMYDELIESTDGYVVNGNWDQDGVKAAMDCYHKVAAVSALFTPVEVELA